MKYYWKKQCDNKREKSICGHIAVSIILHISKNEVIKLIGHNNGTWTRELVKVLQQNNIKCDKRLQRTRKSDLCIAKLKYPNRRNYHCVVLWKDKIFDGMWGKKDGTVEWAKEWVISSYLNIY